MLDTNEGSLKNQVFTIPNEFNIPKAASHVVSSKLTTQKNSSQFLKANMMNKNNEINEESPSSMDTPVQF